MTQIGKGKIKVRFKCDSTLGPEVSINCKHIEIYGDKLAFSDSKGNLVRINNRIFEAPLSDILSIGEQ